MDKLLTQEGCKIINNLSSYRRERLLELLSLLYSNPQVSGILLGGSLSYKQDFAKSDIDLFCLTSSNKFEQTLKGSIKGRDEVDEVIYQGFFPWTEKLYTIFYRNDLDLSIDLCLIENAKGEDFFWEPNGCILFDKGGTIEKFRKIQMRNANYNPHPFLKQNPFSLSIITLKKIEKNLSRQHIWNALEQLNILRRYAMQIIRMNVIKHHSFLGRVDRDIEDVLPKEINKQLAGTVADYSLVEVANKTALLIKMLETLFQNLAGSSENEVEKWFLKQLYFEKEKISAYICIDQNT